jgi:hypothetical protein
MGGRRAAGDCTTMWRWSSGQSARSKDQLDGAPLLEILTHQSALSRTNSLALDGHGNLPYQAAIPRITSPTAADSVHATLTSAEQDLTEMWERISKICELRPPQVCNASSFLPSKGICEPPRRRLAPLQPPLTQWTRSNAEGQPSITLSLQLRRQVH